MTTLFVSHISWRRSPHCDGKRGRIVTYMYTNVECVVPCFTSGRKTSRSCFSGHRHFPVLSIRCIYTSRCAKTTKHAGSASVKSGEGGGVNWLIGIPGLGFPLSDDYDLVINFNVGWLYAEGRTQRCRYTSLLRVHDRRSVFPTVLRWRYVHNQEIPILERRR